jgi:kinetochore protein Mis13/DSN1
MPFRSSFRIFSDLVRRYDREHQAWRALVAAHKAANAKEATRMKEQLSQLSEKAKGKLKSIDMEPPQSLHLSDSTRVDSLLAAKVIGLDVNVDGKWGLESKIEERMKDRQFLVDKIYRAASTSRMMAIIAEGVLDLHNVELSSLLRTRSTLSSSSSVLPTMDAPSPHALLRALAFTDKRRAPGMYSQSAIEARREVRRIEESGERTAGAAHRVTPAPPMTPRKMMMPGTPRRGSTPGRR